MTIENRTVKRKVPNFRKIDLKLNFKTCKGKQNYI